MVFAPSHPITQSMNNYTLRNIATMFAVFALTSCSKKEKVTEIAIEMDIVSYEGEYHATSSGAYQISSNKIETRLQLMADGVKVSDETDTDEELPDKSAGEFDSLSFEWKDNKTLKIREFSQENMDDALSGAPPFKWDHTYELEILSGSREDFDAGRTISVRYTEASMKQLREDLGKYIETYFSEFAPILLEEAAGGGIDMASTEIESELEIVTIANTPCELSKSKCIINSKNDQNIRIKWILYKTK